MNEVDVVICAGGTGTRLRPLTAGVNKHLLPMWDEPLICHAVRFAKSISDRVLIVTEPDAIGSMSKVVDDCCYAVQDGPNGIADAINGSRFFCRVESTILVLLADNLFDSQCRDVIRSVVKSSSSQSEELRTTHCFVSKVTNASDYGVLQVDADGFAVGIEEKPSSPMSDLAVAGAYLFNQQLWHDLFHLTLSDRGEYEVTDLLRAAMDRGELAWHPVEGRWQDVGGSINQYAQSFVSQFESGNNK